MTPVRVFLLTCRRPALLPRALASLRAQTFTDWTCELHNDAPEDDFPRQLVDKLGDPRITLHHHAQNWGPIKSFNHAFAGGPEPFGALLEDDNWWEPSFLAEALSALSAEPAANVAWANLRVWREESDGAWTDTGRCIWENPSAEVAPRLFRWPVARQSFDALHSNGAMVFRSAPSRAALVPPNTPFDIIEPVRERLLAGAWLFLPRPLANFALTRRTARAADPAAWLTSQLLVAASYHLSVRPNAAELAELWCELRRQRPPATSLLFHLAFAGVRPGAVLRHARGADWLRFLAGVVRRPTTFFDALRFRSRHPDVWEPMLTGAIARTAESPPDVSRGARFLHKALPTSPASAPNAHE